jgi:cell division protein FtsL
MNKVENVLTKKRALSVKGLFSYRWILNNLVFFLFVAFLAILYIANGHEADKMMRDINKTASDIKDLKYEYKTLKSEEIFRSRQAQVEQAAAKLGLAMPSAPPVHITAETGK